MSYLSLHNVSKSYRGPGGVPLPVLSDVSLEVAEGEFVAIVGYSGTGKTTLINLLAGLVRPDSGTITHNGQPVRGPSPERAVVFQNYSLLPWLSASGNIDLAVRASHRSASPEECRGKVAAAIDLVRLSHAAERLPRQLSGGMRQRVSLARGLAMDPAVLLLDEPLSALDALTRGSLQDEIARIWQESRKTVVLITNDVDEAILLADRVIPIMGAGPATLGEPIAVSLPRPRNRKALNHHPDFQRIRRIVLEALISQRQEKTQARQSLPPRIARPPENISHLSTLGRWMLRGEARARRKSTNLARRPPIPNSLEFTRLTKTFNTPKGPAVIVKDFDLHIRPGEFVCLIGHSGCGKSTVLSMAAGLLEPTSGGVILAGREIDGAGPDRGVVFQSPCLLPWLTALENVLLGVDQVYFTATKAEQRDHALHFLSLVGLEDAANKRPAELSQGMRQRVGIARAFAIDPKVLLLDEPFGMLDKLTKLELQDVLLRVWGDSGKTALMVTHDVDEAIYLSDRVVMMTNGPEAQVGDILEIPFPRPRDRHALLEDPRYYELREHLISYLEEKAHLKGADRPLVTRTPLTKASIPMEATTAHAA